MAINFATHYKDTLGVILHTCNYDSHFILLPNHGNSSWHTEYRLIKPIVGNIPITD